ncbi:hypothetical protein HYV74_01605 [Candidatus Uhrbacteria bacterium]|nr:hypothetical protein [Candidatus Uhrbacteria bacterium]
MKILVIDDTRTNLDAAKQVLPEHELTLVTDYDRAYKLLERPKANYDAVQEELKRRGFRNEYDRDASKQERDATRVERSRLEVELCPPPPFDAVLCDLLMPAGRTTQGPKGERYVGQEMPVGWALALMAVLQGAKHVAVVTNLNHHDHPAAAMLDRLCSGPFHVGEPHPVKLHINGAPVDFVNDAPMVPVEGTTCADCGGSGTKAEKDCWLCNGSGRNEHLDKECHPCKGSGREVPTCYSCRGSGKVLGKDWSKVLARLLGTETPLASEDHDA